MRGLGKFIVGYILGNDAARNWCIKKVCQASCVIENEFKKSELGKMFLQTSTAEVKEKRDAENKPKKLMIGESYAQED